MRKSSIKIKSRAIGTKPIREITTKMKKKRILGFGIYLNEAVMENEAQQLSRDILLVGVNLRHRRPHNGLNFWASLAVEIVFKIRLTSIIISSMKKSWPPSEEARETRLTSGS
ncbi:hypothetical protein ACFX13_019505 [Malus domestica]